MQGVPDLPPRRPRSARVGRAADPQPRADEVLVRVRACALNHLDLWVRRGIEGVTYPLPLIPGSEIAGEVEGLGELVDGSRARPARADRSGRLLRAVRALRRGRGHVLPPVRHPRRASRRRLRRAGGGATAQRTAAAARPLVRRGGGAAAGLHDRLANADHAGLRSAPLEDVLDPRRRLRAYRAPRIQIARLLGARHIIATAGGEAKLERALELGATHALDYRQGDWAKEARRDHRRQGGRRGRRSRRRRGLRAEPPGPRLGRPGGPVRRDREARRQNQSAGRLLEEPLDPRLDHGQPGRAAEPSFGMSRPASCGRWSTVPCRWPRRRRPNACSRAESSSARSSFGDESETAAGAGIRTWRLRTE